MAETKKFVLEGKVTLAYFADENDGKHILLKPQDTGSKTTPGVDPSTLGTQERLEAKVADELSFPSDTEFDEVFEKLEALRADGLRPDVGVPIVTREGVNLRITVEVLS